LKRRSAESWTFNDYAGRFKPQEHTDAPFEVIRQDLNFAELGEKKYDLVIVDSLLHHLINVEDLIDKVSLCLVPGGYLVILLDYCGERRFLWESKHREQMDQILSDIPLKYLRYPLCSVSAIHFSPISPFEAVSGPELPQLLHSKFQTVRFKASHGILFPVLAYLKKYLLEADNGLVDNLLEADQSVPGSFFSAVYRQC
jgi:SAM-dependent methyltransferase